MLQCNRCDCSFCVTAEPLWSIEMESSHKAVYTVILCVRLSDHQMMSRPLSAVGCRRPLSHYARMAMITRPEMRYKVSCSRFPSLNVHAFTHTRVLIQNQAVEVKVKQTLHGYLVNIVKCTGILNSCSDHVKHSPNFSNNNVISRWSCSLLSVRKWH